MGSGMSISNPITPPPLKYLPSEENVKNRTGKSDLIMEELKYKFSSRSEIIFLCRFRGGD
jgi:hypothetical protein